MKGYNDPVDGIIYVSMGYRLRERKKTIKSISSKFAKLINK